MIAVIAVGQTKHEAVTDRIQLKGIAGLWDAAHFVGGVVAIRAGKICHLRYRIRLATQAKGRVRGSGPVHVEFPNPQRGVRRHIGRGVYFSKIIRRAGRRQREPVEVRREVSAKANIDGPEIKRNQLRWLPGEHFVALEGPHGRAYISRACRVELMRAHVIPIGPQADVRIVLELGCAKEKIINVICARSVRGLRDGNTFVPRRGRTAGRAEGKGELTQQPAVRELVIDDNRIAVVVVFTCSGQSAP